MLEFIWSCLKLKCSPQEVYTLMWEATWRRGKLKLSQGRFLFHAGNHVEEWEIEMFTKGSVPFKAGNHVEAWEIEMFTKGRVPFEAGNHVEAVA